MSEPLTLAQDPCMTTRRLQMLEQLTASGSRDPFAWYGLALEYRSLGRAEDALATFEALRQLDATYLAAYLMAGQLLVELGRSEAAREWLSAGVTLARQRGDVKTLSELEAELEALS